MAGQNRLLRGNTQRIQGTVRGNTTVEPGDLIGINTTNGYYGNSYTQLNAADYYLYPLTSMRAVTPGTDHIVATTFMGIAMTGSESGTTNDIIVATNGIFRFPLVGSPSAVTLGARVSSVSGSLATGVSRAAVAANATRNAVASNGSSAYLGVIVKTESGASYVDFQLITATSGGSIA